MTSNAASPKQPSLRKKQIVCIALAFVPFAGSLAAQAIGPTEQTPEAGASRPALVFDQYHVNLGRVSQGVKNVDAHFRFRNSSTRDVKITALEPSCGCLNPRLDKREFSPKEGANFSLRVETTHQTPGAHDYHVDLRYEDPEPRVVRVTFHVFLPEPTVEIRPVGLLFYQLSDVESEQTAIITDYRSQPLSIRNIRSENEYATAEVSNIDTDVEGHTRFHISVYASGHVPPGTRKRGRILIETNDPEYKTIALPLEIFGPAKSQPVAEEADSAVNNLRKASVIFLDPSPDVEPETGATESEASKNKSEEQK